MTDLGAPMLFGWDDIESMLNDFEAPADALRGFRVLVAEYETASYEGSAFVLLLGDDGKLYEVNGSHCSCNGLECQWEPTETTWGALVERKFYGMYHAKGWITANAPRKAN